MRWMEENMLKIGEFSRLTGVPVKTLRYYAEIGLFEPASVDQETGYRHYTLEQVAVLNRILVYKSQGFPLNLISKLLSGELSPELVRGILRQRKFSSQQSLEREQERLSLIDSALEQLNDELESDPAAYPVSMKLVDPIRAACLKGQAGDLTECGAELGRLADKVIRHILKHQVALAAPGIALYHEFGETHVELEFAQPINGDLPETAHIQVRTLPAIETAAFTYHYGRLDRIDHAHQAIMGWMESKGYRLCGAVRDVYLKYHPDMPPSEYITEIQYPVEKVS